MRVFLLEYKNNNKTMTKNFLKILVAFFAVSCAAPAVKEEVIKIAELPAAEDYVFVLADAGRNGSYDQTRVGNVMNVYADSVEPEFVLNCGDMFHYNGVQSVNDPLFMTNFELIYSAGELQCPWWGVLGNHEYHGNTQAILDYTNVSRRWNVPSRYYAKTFEANEDTKDSVMVIFIDSAPLIDKYHIEEGYPDARLQDVDKQLKWIDETLAASTAKWKIAVCHHPIYSYSKKSPKETEQMQDRLAGMFEKYGVDMSLSGHVHTFQHIQPKGAKTNYFVSPSASLGRKPRNGEFTTFNYDGAGFLILGLNSNDLSLTMINRDGDAVYSYTIEK